MTNDRKYEASYFIEVQTPFSEEYGFDFETAPDLVSQTGEVWNAGCGFGVRDASGPANFDSLKDAYVWLKETQATLDAKYGPESDAKALFWLEATPLDATEVEEETTIYINPPQDLDAESITDWSSLEVEIEDGDVPPDTIKWSQIEEINYVSLDRETQGALDQAAKIETETITTHKEALAKKRF